MGKNEKPFSAMEPSEEKETMTTSISGISIRSEIRQRMMEKRTFQPVLIWLKW